MLVGGGVRGVKEPAECAAGVAARVAAARAVQTARYEGAEGMSANADAVGDMLEEIARPDSEARGLLRRAADRFGLSARGYHRVMRVARTIADLAGSAEVRRPHMAEAISFRQPDPARRAGAAAGH